MLLEFWMWFCLNFTSAVFSDKTCVVLCQQNTIHNLGCPVVSRVTFLRLFCQIPAFSAPF